MCECTVSRPSFDPCQRTLHTASEDTRTSYGGLRMAKSSALPCLFLALGVMCIVMPLVLPSGPRYTECADHGNDPRNERNSL